MSETTDEMEYVLRNSLDRAERTIADLRSQLDAETYTVIQLNSIGEKYKASLRHSNYKRCLAMASTCRLCARWFGDNAFYKKERWALQWHRRWLKIAEQFKEAS